MTELAPAAETQTNQLHGTRSQICLAAYRLRVIWVSHYYFKDSLGGNGPECGPPRCVTGRASLAFAQALSSSNGCT